MSNAAAPIPDSLKKTTLPPRKRPPGRRRLLLLLLGLLLVGGLFFQGFFWLVPRPRTWFLPLWMIDHQNRPLAPPPQSVLDRDALLGCELFPHRLNGLNDLAGLSPGDQLVVYLCGQARCDEKGHVVLLPTNAEEENARTHRPLQTILQTLAASPNRKLLILDLFWPMADAHPGALADDVAARIPDELAAVKDPQRLVLCSCSPGQLALTSEDLHRSVFGCYLEEGLRGCAGLPGSPGQITVKQLARFVEARVDRWARQNRNLRQAPVLYGDAADFPLVAGEPGTSPDHFPAATTRIYPEYLRDGWKKRDLWWSEGRYRLAPWLFRRMDAVLLEAERNWRGGGVEERIRNDLRNDLARLETAYRTSAALTLPPALSLAQEMQFGGRPNPVLTKAVRVLMARAEEARRLAKPDEVEKALAKLVEEFAQKQKNSPDFDLAWAVFECLADDPLPRRDTVRFLNQLLRSRAPDPNWTEQVGLRRLADLAKRVKDADWPVQGVRLAIDALRLGEQAGCQPRSFPWIEGLLESAAQKRHDGEVMLYAPGFVSAGAAEVMLGEAVAEFQALRARQEVLETALRLRDEALAQAPAYLPYLEHAPNAEPAWLAAIQALTELDPLLTPPPNGEREPDALLNARIDEIRHQTALLQGAMNRLLQPFSRESCADLVQRSQRSEAGPAVFGELDALLRTPFLSADARQSVWQASRQLGRRLLSETHAMDENEGKAIRPLPYAVTVETEQDLGQRQVREKNLSRARWSLALLRLAGLERSSLLQLEMQRQAFATANAQRAGDMETRNGFALAHALQQAWLVQLSAQFEKETDPQRCEAISRILPAYPRLGAGEERLARAAMPVWQRQTAGLWGWLLERCRYESAETDAPPFYALAAFTYREYARGSEPLLVMARQPTVLDVKSAGPTSVTALLPLTIPASRTVRSRLALTVLKADDDSFQITPNLSVLTALPDASSDAPAAIQVPVHVTLRKQAESARPAQPKGFLLRVEAGGRSYHHKFVLPPLPAPERLELLLSANPQTPTAPLAEMRMRPSRSRRPFYAYVHNGSDHVRKVGVEMWANGRLLTGDASMTVNPGQTVRVVLPAANGGPAATDLQELTGPLQIRLVDKEKNGAVILTRDVRVSIAPAAEEVCVSSTRFEPPGPTNGFKNRLEVTLAAAAGRLHAPCVAELVLPPRRIPGLKEIREGRFRVEVPASGEEVKLWASDLAFDPLANEDGCFHLNIDGLERAFVFRTTFARSGKATIPIPDDRPALRLHAAPYSRANTRVEGEVEVDNAPPEAQLELSMGQKTGAAFEPEIINPPTQARRQRVGFGVRGDGGLEFEVQVRDWRAQFDAVAVRGERTLRARLLDRTRKELLPPVYRKVVCEDQPPDRVVLMDLPKQALPGAALSVKALGIDKNSEISQVVFFLGQAVGDKIPAAAFKVPGQPLEGQPPMWTAQLPLPADRKGPLEIGVQVTNKLGLKAFAAGSVELIDVEKEKPTYGVVIGTVVEGDRPQVGLTVILCDEKNHTISEVQTKEGGAFRFEMVPPGKYTVTSRKKTSTLPRVGKTDVEVKTGATSKVKVELFSS
jgi:Carboxypeptidase regulatory-like domain